MRVNNTNGDMRQLEAGPPLAEMIRMAMKAIFLFKTYCHSGT